MNFDITLAGINVEAYRALESQQRMLPSAINKAKVANISKTIHGLYEGVKESREAIDKGLIGFSVILGLTEENNSTLRFMKRTLVATTAVYTLFKAYNAIVKTMQAKEAILASAETAVAAVGQQWHSIAIALATAAAVGAAFTGGYLIAQSYSGDADISKPEDRRAIAATVQGARA